MDGLKLEMEQEGLRLTLTAQPMGRDWNVTITGGEVPHLGAAALGAPYRHPDGSIGSSASVLVLPSHKEDGLVKQAAERLAKRLDCAVLVSGGIGILFILLGNYMPRIKQNYTFGCRTPWALADEHNWNRTQRMGGITFVVMGVALLFLGLFAKALGEELTLSLIHI